MATSDSAGETALVNVDDIKSLARHNDQLQSHIKDLELQLLKRDADVRRATEEHALRRELHTINQLSLRKMSNSDLSGSQAGRMKISDESLAQVISLEDRIKAETRKTQELERQAERVNSRFAEVEQRILNQSQQIAIIKDQTGWERDNCASRGYVNPVNAYREHQKIIADLEERQVTVKGVLDKLTAKLENLSVELERRKNVDEETGNALMMLKGKEVEYDRLMDQKKSLQRLLQKKEKMLKDTESKDDYKSIKILEGEKRVLHNELARNHEQTLNNSKSILAQEVRLRQLEMRLAAMNQFLQQVLTFTEEDVLPEGIPADATEVPVEVFDGIQRELAISRHTVIQRDAQLEAQDAKVEQLEKKVNILHCAIVTRTGIAAQEAQEMEKEYNVVSIHLEYMQSEFNQEHHKLLMENDALTQKLRAHEGLDAMENDGTQPLRTQ